MAVVKVLGGYLEIEGGGVGGGSPGVPTQPIYNPAYPAHPIHNPPPGMWPGGPVDPGYGVGRPSGGVPTQPIYNPAYPAHPIYNPPPGMWPGGPIDPGYGVGRPPSSIPPQPTEPPPDGADKPPPETGGWGFVAEWSKWGYFPKEGEAQPKG